MLIPDFSATKQANTLIQLTTEAEFRSLRENTTDKLICVLMVAEWDQASQQLKTMLKEMPTKFTSVKFCWVDCEQVEGLVDQFKVESVPSLVLVHPHKKQY